MENAGRYHFNQEMKSNITSHVPLDMMHWKDTHHYCNLPGKRNAYHDLMMRKWHKTLE